MPDQNEETHSPSGASVFALINLILRSRWRIVLPGLLLGVATGVLQLGQARTYTSTASFIPGQQDNPAALSGLAAQFGLSVGSGSGSWSPEFFAELLASPEIHRRVVLGQYRVEASDSVLEGTLAEILEIEGNQAFQVSRAVRFLKGAASIRHELRTGIVAVDVTVPWPSLALDLAQALLDEVNDFNIETRQSGAAAERIFVEGRLATTEGELAAAEQALQEFLASNRQFISPQLDLERGRLQRRISHHQEVFTSLASSLEQSRIAEVRQTPLINIIESPIEAVQPNGRGTVRRAAMATALGWLLAFAFSVVRDRLRVARASGDRDLEEFFRIVRELNPRRRT